MKKIKKLLNILLRLHVTHPGHTGASGGLPRPWAAQPPRLCWVQPTWLLSLVGVKWPAAFPGWDHMLPMALPFWGPGSGPAPSAPLGIALMGTFCKSTDPTFLLGITLVEDVCAASSPVAGFCLGSQAFHTSPEI